MTTENIVDNELSGTVHELPAVLREMADYRIKSNREMRHLLGCEPHEELGVRSLLKAAYVLERHRYDCESYQAIHNDDGELQSGPCSCGFNDIGKVPAQEAREG